MGRVPRVGVLTSPLTVVVANAGASLAVASPVVTSSVPLTTLVRGTIEIRSGEDIVHVWRVTAAIYDATPLSRTLVKQPAASSLTEPV